MEITDKVLEILNTMASAAHAMQGLQGVQCLQRAESMQCVQPEACCGFLRTVMYESGFGANLRLDRKPTPAAILYMAEGFKVDVKSGRRKDSVDVEVFFCERCDLSAKGEAVKAVMDGVEPVVDEFVARVMAEKSWEVADDISVTTAYGKFDTNVCGFSVQLTLVDRKGRCMNVSDCICG